MGDDNKNNKDKKLKIFEVNISKIKDVKDIVKQYFALLTELLKDQKVSISKIYMSNDSDIIIAEGSHEDYSEELPEEDEDTDWDYEWV